MLVFSDQHELDQINKERINLHFEEQENIRISKKQEIYKKMADDQFNEVIATFMSLTEYNERRYTNYTSR